MTLARAKAPKVVEGCAKPRVAPPLPARSLLVDFETTALEIGFELFPWQKIAARYLTALGPEARHLYREVAIVVARQNGKTTLLVPYIVMLLRAGKRVMHTAQNRDLPREVFAQVADIMQTDMSLFPERNGRAIRPRFANGQEEIKLTNGGIYRIVAPTRGGARGPSNDVVIIDELREMDNFDFIAAAKPTLMASPDPQIVELSNAGEDDSLVLNTIRLRAESDPSLAYLEWSASPERSADDRMGWLEANPSIGHKLGLAENLEADYLTYQLSGTLSIFETENLCRWVTTTRKQLVDAYSWINCKAETLEAPRRPWFGISMAPEGTRASVVMAWRQSDDTVALRLLYNVTGNPIDPDRLGSELRRVGTKLGIAGVVYDPLTDAALAKFWKKPEPVSGQKFANATSQFVNIVSAGRLGWIEADAVSDDLTWTASKHDRETGTFEAVRSQDDHPITASLAAIRAVWRASDPKPPAAKVY